MELLAVSDAWDEVADLFSPQLLAPVSHNTLTAHWRPVITLRLPTLPQPIALQVHQNLAQLSQPGVTGTVVWDSAVVLSRLLCSASDRLPPALDVRGATCLELGTGTGCVAMALAAGAGVRRVVATDALATLEGCAGRNIRANADLLGRKVEMCELVWGAEGWEHAFGDVDDAAETGDCGFDFVICSDCVYNDAIVGALVACLKGICRKSDTVRRRHEMDDAIDVGRPPDGATKAVIAQVRFTFLPFSLERNCRSYERTMCMQLF
ncbi:hypothetical protein HK101_005196 [Irineochytrium annulatum]|nr:hypothetical protein HK101_005196 [Irineochytrium annulatum]